MCQTDVPVSRDKRIIIAHAGCDSGWIGESLLLAKNINSSCVDYHECMTVDLFENWFSNKLLPFLSPASVTIIEHFSKKMTYISKKATQKATSRSFRSKKFFKTILCPQCCSRRKTFNFAATSLLLCSKSY